MKKTINRQSEIHTAVSEFVRRLVVALVFALVVAGSASAEVLCSEDFSSGDRFGNPGWRTLAGRWSVTTAQEYTSSKRKLNLSQVEGINTIPDKPYLVKSWIRLTRRAKGRPNAGIVFALQDQANYLTLMVKKKKLILKQKGGFTGEIAGRKTSVRANFKVGRWYLVAVSIGSDGTVKGYVNNLDVPVLGYNFRYPEALSGGVGLMASKARSIFDDFTVENKVSGGDNSSDSGQSSSDSGQSSSDSGQSSSDSGQSSSDSGQSSSDSGQSSSSAPSLSGPTDLQALATSASVVQLRWKDNSGDEDGFIVEQSKYSCTDGFAVIGEPVENEVGFQVRGLDSAQFYCFRVRAVKGQIFSEYSNAADATTLQDPNLLAAPSDLTVQVMSHTSMKVYWKDNSDNEDGFVIEQAVRENSQCGGFIPVGQVNTGAIATFTVTDLTPQTEYCFRVRGFQGNLLSHPSNVVAKGTPSAPAGPPQGALSISGQVLSATSIALNWTDVQDEKGYEIYLSKNGGTWQHLVNVEPDGIGITVVDLDPNSNYEFGIIAFNDYGDKRAVTVVLRTLSSGKGTIQVWNHTGHRILQIEVNGVRKLATGEVVPPGGYWYDNNFQPGNYTVVAGVGLSQSEGYFFTSQAQHSVQADKTSQHFVIPGDLLKGAEGWYGNQWNTEPWTEHKIVFASNNHTGITSFSRYQKTNGGWSMVQRGNLTDINWPALGPIVSFRLGAGGAYSSVAFPFQNLFSNIAVGGGSQLLSRQ